MELLVALIAGNSGSQAGIMGRARRAEIDAHKLLTDQAVTSPRVSSTTWSPWGTTSRVASLSFGSTCRREKQE